MSARVWVFRFYGLTANPAMGLDAKRASECMVEVQFYAKRSFSSMLSLHSKAISPNLKPQTLKPKIRCPSLLPRAAAAWRLSDSCCVLGSWLLVFGFRMLRAVELFL